MCRVIPVILVLLLATCGSSAASQSSTHSTTPAASPAGHTRTYPEQKADNALCSTFSTDMASGDTFDLGQALQNAQGTISPKLGNDIATVVNENGTLQQDLTNQILVTEDCALAKVGVQPGSR